MTDFTPVLDHVVRSISPASAAQAAGARQWVAEHRSPPRDLGGFELLVERLAAARHSPRPVVKRKSIVVCAGDHGVADPGIDLGENSPTIVALRHLAAGRAAVNTAARTAGAELVLVDCGVRGGDRHDLGRGVIELRVRDGSRDITCGPALTEVEAITAVESGIALLFSLADQGLDLLALGHLSAGSQPATGAVIAALVGMTADQLATEDREVIAVALATNRPDHRSPIEVLANLGGCEIGVMVGLILGAASINIPVVLDDHGTSAAALIAARLCPAVAGYLIAAHPGATPGHGRALAELELIPLFNLGLAQGEGAGAALSLPLIAAAADLLADR